MMHKWESLPKLVSEWERQVIPDPFVYKDFVYDCEEFDNVPPVIPRFQFYMQLSIKPLVKYLKFLKDGQQVPELRSETASLVRDTNEELQSCEARLMD